MEARKLSFQEAWDSSTIFFVDEALEQEIDAAVEALLETARDCRVSEVGDISVDGVADFLRCQENALDVILKDIGLSEVSAHHLIAAKDGAHFGWLQPRVEYQPNQAPDYGGL